MIPWCNHVVPKRTDRPPLLSQYLHVLNWLTWEILVCTQLWRLTADAYTMMPPKKSWTDPNCHCIRSGPPTFNTILKGGFLNIEMADIRPWPVSIRKNKPSESNIRNRDSTRREDFRLLSQSLVPFFTWHYSRDAIYTILKSMRIIPLPLSNNYLDLLIDNCALLSTIDPLCLLLALWLLPWLARWEVIQGLTQ